MLVRHDLLGLSTVDGSGDVLAGWRGVVRTVLPRADVAFCRGALDVADELLDGHAEQTLYYGGSPRLTLQLGAALQGAVESRETGLHICEWVDRWRDAGAPPPMPPQLDIISLEDEHRDFRAALGVSVRPRGLADWTE